MRIIIDKIIKITNEIIVILGLPRRSKDLLYNSAIIIQNCKNHLKIGGFLMLIVPTKNIDFANNTSKKNQEERKKLQTSFDIIQEINLTDFFKEYSMVIAKYLG